MFAGKVLVEIEAMRDYAVKFHFRNYSIPIISPSLRGISVYWKARCILNILDEIKKLGFGEIKIMNAPDPQMTKEWIQYINIRKKENYFI